MGTKEEYGKLALGENENFCMGGPGIIFSRETLARFTPHIKKCLRNFYTYHEDVELGRCVHKYANTSCTWSYEMQHILYNHPNKTDGYRASNLLSTDILRAVSLHSIKNIRVFTRVHNFALQRRIMEFEQRTMLLHRQIDIYDQILSIQNQIKLQAKNLSKFIQTTKTEQIKVKLKQQYKLLNMPDQQIANQILSLSNHTFRLFTNNNDEQQGKKKIRRKKKRILRFRILEEYLWNILQNYVDRNLSSQSSSNDSSPSISFKSIRSNENIDPKKLSRPKHEPGIYTLFTASQYSANAELPVRSIEPSYRQCFQEVVRTYMEDVNKVSRSMGRFLEYKKTLYGYYKHEPRHGMNYILDLFLIYRKYSGKKMSVSIENFENKTKPHSNRSIGVF